MRKDEERLKSKVEGRESRAIELQSTLQARKSVALEGVHFSGR
jgi:hypothetical protein